MKHVFIVLLLLFVTLGCQKDTKNQAQNLASRATYLTNDGKHSEAIPLLREAVSLQPNCAEYHVGLAMAYVNIGEHSKAREEYEKALPILRKQAEDDPEKVDDLVMVLVCLNRRKEADSVFANAKDRFKDNQTISMIADNYDEIIESFSEIQINE